MKIKCDHCNTESEKFVGVCKTVRQQPPHHPPNLFLTFFPLAPKDEEENPTGRGTSTFPHGSYTYTETDVYSLKHNS